MDKKVEELYNLWVENANQDRDLIEELNSIKDNEDEIYERFYKELEFGTGGLRGIIGAGCNRMNIYTVARATQGLANYLNSKYTSPSVAISYDSRIKSDVFAQESARVLAANGIKVYMVKELKPTPVLSFAVRDFGCKSGIMVTASHNPAKYNGYKCYDENGCQMTDNDANRVFDSIMKVDTFKDVKRADFQESLNSGMINWIEDSFYDKYLDKVQEQCVNPRICIGSDLKIVYTPLNGSGNKLVRGVLSRIGIKNVLVVPEQENPDGNFPTCPYPNPEFKEALQLALDLADKENADLVLATDPDSDRVGIAVRDGSQIKLLTGNEVGVMLLNYILSCKKSLGKLPNKAVVVKTIVSTPLADKICKKYNCDLKNVLTGFKYIGDQIYRLEKNNEEMCFMFGFEESYGYLAGTYVRDKDAVVASMLICEMVEYYRKKKKNLCQVMDELYKEHGFYKNSTLNFAFEGSSGMEKMKKILSDLRKNELSEIAGHKVLGIADYLESKTKNLVTGKVVDIDLPKSNVLEYILENDLKVIIRPSGTEPKVKAYLTAVGKDEEESDNCMSVLSEAVSKMIV